MEGKEIWIAENRVYLSEDNIIHFTNVGEHDDKVASACKDAILRLFDMTEGTVHGLIDLNRSGQQSTEARKMWREISELERTGKVAIFGIHPVARLIASFVMGISKNRRMRFFKTEEDAKKAFLCRVRNVGMQRTKLVELGLPISCLADEIQLVAYNEAMTWLEEIKSWRAA